MAGRSRYFLSAGIILFVIVSICWGVWMWSDNKHLADPNRFERLYRKGFRVESIRGDGAVIMAKRAKDGQIKRKMVRNTSTVDPMLLTPTPTPTTTSQPAAAPVPGKPAPTAAPGATPPQASKKYHYVPVKDPSGHLKCVKVKTQSKTKTKSQTKTKTTHHVTQQSSHVEHNVIVVHKGGKKITCVPKAQDHATASHVKCKPVTCHPVHKVKTYHHPCGTKVKVYKHTYHDLHGNRNLVHVHSRKHKQARCNVYHVWVKKHQVLPNKSYHALQMHEGKLGVHVPGHVSKQNKHFFGGVNDVTFIGIRQYHGKRYRCWKNVKQAVAFDPKYYAPHRRVLIKVPRDKSGHKRPITRKTRVVFCVRDE